MKPMSVLVLAVLLFAFPSAAHAQASRPTLAPPTARAWSPDQSNPYRKLFQPAPARAIHVLQPGARLRGRDWRPNQSNPYAALFEARR